MQTGICIDINLCIQLRNPTSIYFLNQTSKFTNPTGVYLLIQVAGAVSGFLPGGGRDIFRGWGKSPSGWRKKFSGTSFTSAFFFAFLHTTLLIYAHFFTFQTHVIKKYITYIYFSFFFLFVFYILYASLVPLNHR